MLPAAIAHISGELLFPGLFFNHARWDGLWCAGGSSWQSSDYSFLLLCHTRLTSLLSTPTFTLLVPIDSVRFLDACRSLPLPPDLHSLWIELHPFSRCFSMCCILMSFADMFRAPGFNQEAFARTIQDIYLLRVMLVVFLIISFS